MLDTANKEVRVVELKKVNNNQDSYDNIRFNIEYSFLKLEWILFKYVSAL